jgi:hypothetical protein
METIITLLTFIGALMVLVTGAIIYQMFVFTDEDPHA